MRLAAQLRAHRGTLLIVITAIAGFGFLAYEDRSVRHADGIDDTCAWFQMVNRMFPMNRCYSLDEFIEMHGGSAPRAPATTDEADMRPEETAPEHGKTCGTGADYVYSLLSGYDCSPSQAAPR